jgi:hypothetical protein
MNAFCASENLLALMLSAPVRPGERPPETLPKSGPVSRAQISLQKFASVHVTVSNHFTTERGLSSRSHLKTNPAAARAEWRSPRAV